MTDTPNRSTSPERAAVHEDRRSIMSADGNANMFTRGRSWARETHGHHFNSELVATAICGSRSPCSRLPRAVRGSRGCAWPAARPPSPAAHPALLVQVQLCRRLGRYDEQLPPRCSREVAVPVLSPSLAWPPPLSASSRFPEIPYLCKGKAKRVSSPAPPRPSVTTA